MNFLYERFTTGMVFTLFVAVVATVLAAYELSLQGMEQWAFLWFVGIVLIQFSRYRLKRSYDEVRKEDYLSHNLWKRRFVVGVYSVALWQGLGAALVMPYISSNLQFIFHVFLLGLGAGAIAYLATSMMIFAGYLVLMLLPVTLYQFWQMTSDGLVLGLMHLFMIVAYYMGVRRMSGMINDSLHLRFDNEILVNDLQRLLNAVATSNKELDVLSTTDELTGASNFRAFRVGLEDVRQRHVSSGLPLSIAMINIDYYHEYNILYGQEAGNKTLKVIADLLVREIVHDKELVARMSGAEFAAVLPGTSCEGARVMMEKVMQQVHQLAIPNQRSKIGAYLTLSIGVCCAPMSEQLSSRDLILRSDNALRLAKNNGRNRIELVGS